MNNDLISRQAAIDALDMAIERYDEMAEEYRKKADIERNDYMDMRDDAYEARQLAQWLNELKYLREKIEQLAIKPEQRWIPCSERLPERGIDVLVTRDYDGRADFNKSCRYVEVASRHGEDDDVVWISYSDEYKMSPKNHKVIAWMPLPEPWRGEQE